jgi:hypothetical protein
MRHQPLLRIAHREKGAQKAGGGHGGAELRRKSVKSSRSARICGIIAAKQL